MCEHIKGKTLVARDEGDDANGVIIKLYGEETNEVISIIEQLFEPGLLLPPHVHQNDVWLYVLEGEMHARVDQSYTRQLGVDASPDPQHHVERGARVCTYHRAIYARWVRALLQGLRRTVASRADRARRTQSPWRAARHPFLRRMDCRPQSSLQPAPHRRLAPSLGWGYVQ